MNLFYVLLLGFAVSIDGFVAGAAYGLKDIRMPLASLSIVGTVAAMLTSIAMICAYVLGKVMNTHLTMIVGASLLILLGVWSVFQQYFTKDVAAYKVDGSVTARKLTFSVGRLVISIMAKPETADVDRLGAISSLEAVFLGIALGLDAVVGTFGAALMGTLPLYTPLAVGIIHMLCISAGCYSSSRYISDSIKKRVPYLPGTLFIILGLLRLG